MPKPLPDHQPSGKSCPSCGPAVSLIVRTNHETGSQFLGCPNYPDCRHTEPIPESVRMTLHGQPTLF
jgi:ssDNA-binding Zn-finger/Zn-ribbon topoisomerase 1